MFSIIRQGSKVRWSNQGKGVPPPLHLDVVAIEKGAFGVVAIEKGANFTFTDCIRSFCDIVSLKLRSIL